MQLMLHRRLLVDDHWGVGEALNETAYGKGLVARGKHYLLFDFDKEEAFRRTRLLANELYNQPLVTFDGEHPDTKKFLLLSPPTARNDELPINVNLLSFEPISENKLTVPENLYLARFEHLFDVEEHPTLSLPVKIPMKSFIENHFGFQIISIKELSLGGDRLKDGALRKRIRWIRNDATKNNTRFEPNHELFEISSRDFDEVELQPMEIRTFQIQF